MTNSFKVLENKDIPLKITKVNIVDKPTRAGELAVSDLSLIQVNMTDKFGNSHDITIEVPKIDPSTGTFRVNGQKKCLINQIVQCPITFPKPGESRFESSYAVFRIYSKKLRRKDYLELYMGSYKIPFMVLASYSFGFKETLKLYGMNYEITDLKPLKDEFSCKISKNQYILFKNIDSKLKEQMASSFIHAEIDQYEVDEEFGSHKFFERLILDMTGRLNSTYVITSQLQNIIDPVVKQVLINKQLPYELNKIMKYMADKCIQGYVIERNDLSNQRIRNSEVLVHLAQKQIQAAYTVYQEQVLTGNKQAKFIFSPTKVLSDFNRLELVSSMEYANPIEEMSSMTRVSPVGKSVGGIPDKRAIQ